VSDIYADMTTSGELESIRKGCAGLPGCSCGSHHHDPREGCARVTLADWPRGCGPFRYDAATRTAVGDAAKEMAARLSALAAAHLDLYATRMVRAEMIRRGLAAGDPRRRAAEDAMAERERSLASIDLEGR